MSITIRLYETGSASCPYLPDRDAVSLMVDPELSVDQHLFSQLSHSGFRRSGKILYTPHCPDCSACIAVRIPVQRFMPSKTQKRIWKKNHDLVASIEDIRFVQEHFDLYFRYQQARHPHSSMCSDDAKKYLDFIHADYSNSRLLGFTHHNQLVCVMVFDQFANGISAVYTFFDPQYSNRSLGIYAILYLIELSRIYQISYVHLGYWVNESKKMDYKRQFRPLQGYIKREWIELSL